MLQNDRRVYIKVQYARMYKLENVKVKASWGLLELGVFTTVSAGCRRFNYYKIQTLLVIMRTYMQCAMVTMTGHLKMSWNTWSREQLNNTVYRKEKTSPVYKHLLNSITLGTDREEEWLHIFNLLLLPKQGCCLCRNWWACVSILKGSLTHKMYTQSNIF